MLETPWKTRQIQLSTALSLKDGLHGRSQRLDPPQEGAGPSVPRMPSPEAWPGSHAPASENGIALSAEGGTPDQELQPSPPPTLPALWNPLGGLTRDSDLNGLEPLRKF